MNWIETTVGDYCPFIYGKGLPQKKRLSGRFKVYGSNGCVDYHNESYVNGPGIIIGRKGSVGAVHLSLEPFWPIDTSFYIEKESIEELWFAYYLLKSLGLENMNSDSAVPGLNRDNAHALPIKIPEKEEDRKALGKWISKFDDKIQVNNQLNQTLERIAQAIFKSWFVDFEPVRTKIAVLEAGGTAEQAELAAMSAISAKDEATLKQLQADQPEAYAELEQTAALFPSAMEESELGEIPEGWEVSTIGEEVQISGGGTPSTKNPAYWENGATNWTTPKDLSNLTDKVLTDTERRITESGLEKISSGLLPVDTVLMSSRAPVGYLALAKIPVAINQGYIAMQCKKRLTPEFVLQWASSNMDEIKQRASGTTFAEISKKNFRPISVIVPPENIVSAYSKKAKTIYDKVYALSEEIKTLSSIRNTTLPPLLSGEIDLREPNL